MHSRTKQKSCLTLGILHFLLMYDVCSADSCVSCRRKEVNTHELFTLLLSAEESLHTARPWRWVKTLRSFLPFTGGQNLLAAGHSSTETHSLDGRSARGPPLDAGAKCKTMGENNNDTPFHWLSVPDVQTRERRGVKVRTQTFRSR